MYRICSLLCWRMCHNNTSRHWGASHQDLEDLDEISSLILGCCRAVSDCSQPRYLPGLGFSWAVWVHQSWVVSPMGHPHIRAVWCHPTSASSGLGQSILKEQVPALGHACLRVYAEDVKSFKSRILIRDKNASRLHTELLRSRRPPVLCFHFT